VLSCCLGASRDKLTGARGGRMVKSERWP
jgi:hypothetical protein